MAISYQCDGCKATVDNPMKAGHVIIREYCETCKAKAEEFIAAEEALRVTTREQFVDARAALIAKYSDGGFHLPDVR